MNETKWTKGEWEAARMVHADTGEPLTPEQIAEYVKNAVRVYPDRKDYLFVRVDKPDGGADVCHVGNGPDGPYNARLIVAAPKLYEALERMVEWHCLRGDAESPILDYDFQPHEIRHAMDALAQARGEL